jgi:hypothetical protein
VCLFQLSYSRRSCLSCFIDSTQGSISTTTSTVLPSSSLAPANAPPQKRKHDDASQSYYASEFAKDTPVGSISTWHNARAKYSPRWEDLYVTVDSDQTAASTIGSPCPPPSLVIRRSFLEAWLFIRDVWMGVLLTGTGFKFLPSCDQWSRGLYMVRSKGKLGAPSAERQIVPLPQRAQTSQPMRGSRPQSGSQGMSTSSTARKAYFNRTAIFFEKILPAFDDRAGDRVPGTIIYKGYSLNLRQRPPEQVERFALYEMEAVNLRSAIFALEYKYRHSFWSDSDGAQVESHGTVGDEEISTPAQARLRQHVQIARILFGVDDLYYVSHDTPSTGLCAAQWEERIPAVEKLAAMMREWQVPFRLHSHAAALRNISYIRGNAVSFAQFEEKVVSAFVEIYWCTFGQIAPLACISPLLPPSPSAVTS